MGSKINRREFLKRMGLGMGGLLVASPLLASTWSSDWQAESAVQFAVETALKKGALYADASIGRCEIQGNSAHFAPTALKEQELLGMRICTPEGWRNVVFSKFQRADLLKAIPESMAASPQGVASDEYWITAHFDQEQVKAQHNSDPHIAGQLANKWMRYANRIALPNSSKDLLFCDILLIQ